MPEPESPARSASPARRRSRLARFSLRALLIAVTVVAACLAVWSERARRQRAAVAALRENGARVYYDYEMEPAPKGGLAVKPSPGGVIGLPAESPAPAWLLDTLGVDYFHGVVVVWAYHPHRFDLAEPLKQLPNLKEVHIPVGTVEDASRLERLKRELPGVHVVSEMAVVG